MKNMILIMAAFVSLVFASAAISSEKSLKAFHKDLECIECHGEKTPIKAKNFECSSCHGSMSEMAEITNKNGVRNPHNPPHWKNSMPCEECHKEHKVSYNYCTEGCHSWPEMKIK